jgi:hypothetical protein
MRFPAASAFLALLSTTDAASFFKSSPSITRNYGVDIASSLNPVFRQNGWFNVRGGDVRGGDVRGGATGELSR